jgi:hypothetical protein
MSFQEVFSIRDEHLESGCFCEVIHWATGTADRSRRHGDAQELPNDDVVSVGGDDAATDLVVSHSAETSEKFTGIGLDERIEGVLSDEEFRGDVGFTKHEVS